MLQPLLSDLEPAGFVLAGTVTQFVPGIKETLEDLRYILVQQS